MKKLLMLLLVFTLTGCINEDPIKHIDNTEYDLFISVDTDTFEVDVKGTIHYENTQDNLEELYLMIYPNSSRQFTQENNVDLALLKINNIDYTDAEFTNEDYTALYVELEETYQEEDVLVIYFEYTFDYWTYDRLFVSSDEESIYTMFFYPFVAMYDESGWNIEPYTYSGETYYNEVGDYNVTIELDEDYILAAPGEELSRVTNNGITTYNYELLNARDYSFSASTQYVVYTRTINGIDFSIYALGSLSLSELSNTWDYLEYGFDTYETYVGDYYYDQFILEYGHIFGMESTGIIYCSRNISEETVVHEIVHMWFFSMIGNDQYDYSFLDESLTTYATSFYYYQRYGIDGYNQYLDGRSSLHPRFYARFELVQGDSLLRNVDEFDNQYGYEIYYHGPTIFRNYVDLYLDGKINEFARILSVYYIEYKGEIATLDNFLDLLERESNEPNTKEYFMMHIERIQDPTNTPKETIHLSLFS